MSVIVSSVILIATFSFIPDILTFFSEFFSDLLERKTQTKIGDMMNGRLSDLDIATIEQSEFQNILHQANQRGFNSILSMLSWSFGNIRTIFKFIFATIVIIYINPLAIGFALLGSIPVYFAERYKSRELGEFWTRRTEMYRVIVEKTNLFTASKSLVELKLFSLPNLFRIKINDMRRSVDDETTKVARKTIFAGSIAELFSGLTYGAAIFLVVMDVLHGKSGLGSLVFIYTTLTSFQVSFASILKSLGRIELHRKHANKLYDTLEIEPYLIENEHPTHIDYTTAPEIEFRNVSFIYPGTSRVILHDINFKILAGEKLAIVGLNGAGKTTLIKLMCRIYDPTEGEIFINGVNLKELSLKKWQHMIGILFQDYSLYVDETLRSNIAYGDSSIKIDNERVIDAATMASADGFISQLPKQYDESVGIEFQGGVELSKGQQQKVALARVFYKRAPLMILDEPTAAVDAISEDTIFKSIIERDYNQTIVLISHKFSNVRDADEIILIQNGTILEQGSHDTLMKRKKGKYKELFELQAEGYK
jgi:ABC-type multidrug transport system fused ATPase/permease subunit